MNKGWLQVWTIPALAGENLNVLIFFRQINLATVDIVEGHRGTRPIHLNFETFGVHGFNRRQHTLNSG